MEYYMGRSLTNAMVNLGIDGSVEEALYEVSCLRMEGRQATTCERVVYKWWPWTAFLEATGESWEATGHANAIGRAQM